MKRIPVWAALAAGILTCATAWAQELHFRGFAQKVDPVDMLITVRMANNPRVLPVNPSAVITIGGRVSKLDQIPLNSPVDIIAERDAEGVPRVTRIDVDARVGGGPTAAAPPGSVVRGTVEGVDMAGNSIVVRSTAGDVRIDLGSAPLIVAGRQASLRLLHVGDTVEVQREIPTPGGSEYLTKSVTVVAPAAGRAAGMAQGTTVYRNATQTQRVAGYTGTTVVRSSRGNTYRIARHTGGYRAYRVRRSPRHARTSRAHIYRGHRAAYRHSRRVSYRHHYRARRAGYHSTVRGYGYTNAARTQGIETDRTTTGVRTIPIYRPASPARNPAGYQTQMWRSKPR